MSTLIIPCYIKSSWDLGCLRRLLNSVRDQTVPFERVYLVDDASPLTNQPDLDFVDHIRLPENGGPAKARNVGIDRALDQGAQHLLFTDHDCVLDRDWNREMTRFLESSPFGAVGGMTRSWGNTLLDYYHDINGTLNGKWLLPDRRELWYMPSLNFGMKAEVAQNFAFDERFPTAAGEDVDICLRIRSKHRIGFCAEAKLWHDFGYRSTLTGLPRFIRLFMKYKSSSATLYDGHTVLLWDSSESIYQGTLMSLIYKKSANAPSLTHWIYDYFGEMKPFVRRIDRKLALLPLVLLKSVEWGIYRWYRTPIRRFYGVKGNELIYMITRRCGERCPKCNIPANPELNPDHLALDHFLECLRRLHENLYQVTLTGGEPMIFREDLLRIAEEARKLGVPMVIVTAGALLTEPFLRRYGELRHVLVISLDTVDQEKWKAFRGREHFDRVMINVALAHEILGDRLRVQSVLARESEAEVAGVATFCRERRIQHSIQPYMDFGGTWHGVEGLKVSDEPCAARKNICIYPNGDVVKCFDHRRIPIAREPLGNIGREDIIEILCRRRATEVSRVMKTCNLPCKQMSCNKPAVLLEGVTA